MRWLERVPPHWQRRLDDPFFWIGMLLAAIVVLFLWLTYVSVSTAHTSARQARADAIRIASQRAAADAAYERCIDSIPGLMKVSTHVAGVNEAFEVLINNSLVTIKSNPGDPLNRVRIANVNRLAAAYGKVAAVKALPVPTDLDCVNRKRDALGEPPLKRLPAGYKR